MYLKTNALLVSLIFLIFFGINCSNKENPVQSVTMLEITAEALEIFSGGKLQLNAMVTLSDGSQENVTSRALWSVEPGVIGQVDAMGEFIAFFGEIGTETIRAEYSGESAEIDVVRRAVSLSVTPTRMDLLPGEKQMSFNFSLNRLPKGEYEIIPYFLIDHPEIPTDLWASIGTDVEELGQNYLKIPFKIDSGILRVN